MWFLSARGAHYKHLLHLGSTKRPFLQPPWSHKEIEELRSKSPAFNGTLAADFVLDLFDKWGGVPRFVLEMPARRIHEIRQAAAAAGAAGAAGPADKTAVASEDWISLLQAIGGCPATSVMNWAKQMHVGGAVTDAVSYKLLHLHPCPTGGVGSSVNYQQVQIKFASTWVADQCVKSYLTHQREQLHAWLLAGRDDPALAATCGHLIQGIFHNLIRENPSRHFDRQLLRQVDGHPPADAAAVEPISFPIGTALDAGTNERMELVFASNGQLVAAADFLLLRGEQSNYPSIESLMQLPVAVGPPALTSSFFQVTASMHHPLKVEHLKPVIANTRPGRTQPYHVYFCVPEHNFQAFSAQPYHVTGVVGDVLPSAAVWPQVRGAPMQLLQYKLSVPIASELLPTTSSVKVVSKVTG